MAILCAGIMVLDIVNVVDKYPVEDSDQRCIEQVWQRGGNAANNCSVIALLGENVHLMAPAAKSHENKFLEDDMAEYGIVNQLVYHSAIQRSPTSMCVVNRGTGSRTILFHPHGIPELCYNDFVQLSLSQYKWVHLEGRRNESELIKMLASVDEYNKTVRKQRKIRTSVEIEKAREGLEVLMDKADYVFISKEYAQYRGYTDMTEAVRALHQHCRKGASIVCAWGEKGAAAIDGRAAQYTPNSPEPIPVPVVSPAYPPEQVIDTLSAGDTFNATVIVCLSRGWGLDTAIDMGCRVAGAKCGMQGNKGLKGLFTIEQQTNSQNSGEGNVA